jgi:hypothetical protein
VNIASGNRGVGVAAGVAVGPGPASATADQTVTESATVTRATTTERQIIAFDTVLPLMSEPRMGVKPPHVGGAGPKISPIGPAFGEDVK